MTDLAPWVLAQIAADEAAARAAASFRYDLPEDAPWARARLRVERGIPSSADQHIARHDPARVLAECAAKRTIVEHYQRWQTTLRETPEGWTSETATAYRMAMEWVVLREAQPYADRPGWDPAWGVEM